MPKWSDFGNIWSTVRELDVGQIQEQSERLLTIAIVGHRHALEEVNRLLRSGTQSFPFMQQDSIRRIALDEASQHLDIIRAADLILIAVDVRQPLSERDQDALASATQTIRLPMLTVMLYQAEAALLRTPVAGYAVHIPDPDALQAADVLAKAVLERLPDELHLSAARHLPGLRPVYARDLIAATSFSNASYSLASGLPEQIPVLNVPFVAADLLVLTKNQAILVYKLALAYGAAPDFQARLRELVPVIGGAFLWRQAARSLIGLVPVWGLLPKVAVAYAGTYTTGIAAWRWYESGEMVSRDQLKRITDEAITLGRSRAAELITRAREARSQRARPQLQDSSPGLGERIGQPFRKLGQRLGQLNPIKRK